MLRIGLTGSIAAGKSTVLETLGAMGIPTYSADAAVHALYAGEAAPLVETLFPGTVVDGVVDRRLLAQALAAQPERFPELESIIHPLVRQKGLDFFAAAEQSGADMAVIEVPLLFETGSKYPVDATIAVICDPVEQQRRILARPAMTREKMDMLLARQWPQDKKAAYADHVIDTSGPREQTARKVEALVALLRNADVA